MVSSVSTWPNPKHFFLTRIAMVNKLFDLLHLPP